MVIVRNFIIIKGSIHQEHIIILKKYKSNNRVSKYLKEKLAELKGEIENPQL